MYDDDFTPRPARIKDGPLGGLTAFVAAVALMLLVAAPIQARLGMTGLALTELMLLGLALLFARLGGASMRVVFPIKAPTKRQVAATLVLWGGYFGLAMSATLAVAAWFPDEIFGVSRSLGDFITSWPLPLALLVSALLPAVCEETLCRGYIQHSLRGVNSWVAMAAVAVLFGLLHLSPYRFMPTALLGFAMAYLRHRTGSLVPPMLLHFVNNTFSTLSGYLTDTGTAALETAQMDIMGMLPALICFYAIASPGAIYIGAQLLGPPRPLGERNRGRGRGWQLMVVVALTALLLAGFITGMLPFIEDVSSTGQDILNLLSAAPRMFMGVQ